MEKTPSMLPALTAVPLPNHELRASPTHIQSTAEKEEVPLMTSPVSSLHGSNNPGLLGSQTQPAWSGSSSSRNQDLQLPKRRPTAGKRYQCSGDGCRLVCRSMKELLDHMQVHYRPTESLEGKTFCCSTLGCMESFPNMQDLMGHMKVHYKPNRYFKCENCMSRFRTHRSLFKHLHSCSDAATTAAASSPALTSEKPIFPPTSSLEKEPPGKLLEELPKLQSVIQHFKKEALLPGTMDTALATDLLPAGLPGPLESVPLPASPTYPLLEQSLFGPPSLARFSGPPHPSVSGPFLPYMHPTSYALPQAAVQNRLRPFLPGQGLPVSSAVWKKSQGHSSNSRIVWEHTRGRYNCLQCPYSTASREEMTQHAEDHRKNPSPTSRLDGEMGHSSNSRIVWQHTRGRYNCLQCPYSTASREEMTQHAEDHCKNPSPTSRLDGEMDFGVALPSFHPKLTPEVENSLFSPL
ncbi:zinc finger protein 414 isoform X2 [Candoia aspera]|uniref:zinc finger protein 414 isoform X2 n=1 Tax=Candoia aspera TaxID=51853 RepID=UPI002FD7DAF2